MEQKERGKYRLYLASGIRLWIDSFKPEYSQYFNRKLALFEPGTLDNPKEHEFIPIAIACEDLDKINHSDALLVYLNYYKPYDDSPAGTDTTWEVGYALGEGKPVIVLIKDEEHLHYYAKQWMVSFSINAILTTNKKVAEIVKTHPKFVHTTLLFCQNEQQFESKIIEYLDEYYRSVYSRSGIINFHVDERAREMFSRENLRKNVFLDVQEDKKVLDELKKIDKLKFNNDKDSLAVCRIERNISNYFMNKISEKEIDSAIFSIIKMWKKSEEKILNYLEHSVKPPFLKVEGRKQGVKKTRTELFFELYDLVTHHLVKEKRFIKSETFPYDVGAVVELYNWMNTYALDDVFDNSDHRQKLTTVWKEYSRRDAIYTGILGHLLTMKYMFIIAKENLEVAKKLAWIMNDYNLCMYEGQVLDLMLTFDSEKKKKLILKSDVNEMYSIYLQRIYGICGGFYEAIGDLASKAGNKKEQIVNYEEIDKISPLIGMYYGIIQMIRNDLGDMIITEEISKLSKGMKGVSHSDIVEGKTNIAYIYAFYSSRLNKEERTFLIKCLYKKLNLKEKIRINKMLWKSGAIDFTVELIVNLIEHVKKDLLTEYQETPTRMKWMFDLVTITKEILIPFKQQAIKYGWGKYEYDPVLLEKLSKELIEMENKPKHEGRMYKLKKFKDIM